ncbi:MAG: glycosidase, partial [Gammaproteobacteria bacterium]|nr:glycosidase [Gammaproteobacteria bacterium]
MRAKEQRRPLVRRRPTLLNAESSRVITRPHIPGDSARIKQLVARVLKLSDDDVHHLLEDVYHEFSARHRNFREALQRNFERISENVPKRTTLTDEQRLLLGAYVTSEYSVEAAALFNPSIVPHPDQEGVEKGSLRFVRSFRATGEGHVSSIEFRSGIVDENHDIYFDPVSQYVATPELHTDPIYQRLHFQRKLEELGARDQVMNYLLD